MKIIYSLKCLEHGAQTNDVHPECAERLKTIYKLLEDVDIAEKCDQSGEQHISLVHDRDYIEKIKNMSDSVKDKPVLGEGEVVFTKQTYEAACIAAGCAIKAADYAFGGEKAFALIRPPGHHACSDKSMGFCVFNNIAIAVKYLMNRGKKIFVLDFDLHHGNGTQDILFGEENVKYFSLHKSLLYPGTGIRSENNCINIPLSSNTDTDLYIEKLEKILLPKLKEFKPDIVAVSAGFDFYTNLSDDEKQRDGMVSLSFDIKDSVLVTLKDILKHYKCFYVLEGGYNQKDIAKGIDIFCGTSLYEKMV